MTLTGNVEPYECKLRRTEVFGQGYDFCQRHGYLNMVIVMMMIGYKHHYNDDDYHYSRHQT